MKSVSRKAILGILVLLMGVVFVSSFASAGVQGINVTYPVAGVILSGSLNITFMLDGAGPITFFYSSTGCNGPWNEIGKGSFDSADGDGSKHVYLWDTTTINDSANVCIKIEGKGKQGLIFAGFSNGTFTVNNYCGNDVVEPTRGEVCELGDNSSCLFEGDAGIKYCTNLCSAWTVCERIPVCGNGILEFGEQCDDHNLADSDGCSSHCLTESLFYQDSDGDSYGNVNSSVFAVTTPQGYVSDNTDCDDLNNAVKPGASEVCNDIDDNCNGFVDENLLLTFFQDLDADSYGNALINALACSAPQGYVSDNTDCDDNVNTTNPVAPEKCNGVNDDCNDVTPDGVSESWYNQLTTCGVGACVSSGSFVCSDGNKLDTCNPGTPSDESCDNLDNDCDGTVDEDLTQFAGNQNGLCSGNTQYCATGFWVDSQSNYVPVAESCDNLDNDCDGTVDEDLTQFAGNQNGLCSGNTETCVAGQYVADGNNYIPSSEVCDGYDNDCDGTVDEDVGTIPAYNVLGECSDNFLVCSGGNWVDSQSNYVPVAETCDLLDNDCDALIDEFIDLGTIPADNVLGVCSENVKLCTQGLWVDSLNNYAPTDETCNNLDDDCDGTVDEGLTQSSGEFGVCSANTQTCSEGSWINNNEVVSTDETCNNLDDDCDGTVDEDVKLTFYLDSDGDGYGNSEVTTQACVAPEGYVFNNTDCDDEDEDSWRFGSLWYDGDSDGYYLPVEIFQIAVVDDGRRAICYGSQIPKGYTNETNGADCDDEVSAINPSAVEICDLVDNNCDGTVDELEAVVANNTLGACLGNVQVCENGSWIDDLYNYVPVAETSNGIDDDCNGLVDDGLNEEQVDYNGGSGMCMTKWTCEAWSDCIDGIQTRTCSYPDNYCEPEGDAPKISQSCTSKETSSGTGTQLPPAATAPITGGVIGALGVGGTIAAAGFIAAMILGAWWFAWKRRKKKKN